MSVNTGFKGIDVRQAAGLILIDALLQTSAGALLTTGSTNLRLYELQSDGSLHTYDFSTNTFVTTTPTTPTEAMTAQPSTNGTVSTGLWTYALATTSGFTIGSVYYAHIFNAGASPTDQVRKFQYASAEGDQIMIANGTAGQAYVKSDVEFWLGAVAPAAPPTAAALASLVTTVGVAGLGLSAVPYNGPSAATIQAPLATSSALASLVTTVGVAGLGLSAVPYNGPSAATIQAPLATSSALATLVTTVGVAGLGLSAVPYNGPSAATIQAPLATLANQATILAAIAANSPASGLVVAGSTGTSVTLSGLPTGRNYQGQFLYHPSGECRVAATSTVSGSNYVLTFVGTAGTVNAPFSAVATNDVMTPLA